MLFSFFMLQKQNLQKDDLLFSVFRFLHINVIMTYDGNEIFVEDIKYLLSNRALFGWSVTHFYIYLTSYRKILSI